MPPQLVIITPELTPGSGGVADYTLALLRCWAPIANLRLLVSKSVPAAPQWSENVKALGTTRAAISRQLPAAGHNVLVQYSAYGFNRFGYPRDLIRSLVEWKKDGGGRLVVMFHEIWTFWPFTNKNFVIQQLHRRSLKHLVANSDAVFTSTQSQSEHIGRLVPNAPVAVVPVGSNITPGASTHVRREPGLAVLFGTQPSRIHALQSMSKSLGALAASGQIHRIVCLGHTARAGGGELEHQLLARLNLSGGFTNSGPLGEKEISQLLRSAAFGLFGQTALSCTKSGSFMAYAAHGLNVIADFAEPAQPPPTCWLVAPAELLAGIPQSELDRRAECLRLWQEQNCSWEIIAAKIGRPLGIGADNRESRP